MTNTPHRPLKYLTMLLTTIAALASPTVRGQTAPAAGTDPAAPIVEPTTFLVGRIDLARVDAGSLDQWYAESLADANDIDPAERPYVERTARESAADAGRIRDALVGAGAPVIYFAFEQFPLEEFVAYVPTPTNLSDAQRERVMRALMFGDPDSHDPLPEPTDPKGWARVIGRVGNGVLLAPRETFARLSARADRAGGAPQLLSALAQAPQAAVQIAVAPSEDLRRALEETLPRLPAPLDTPVNALTRGLRFGTLSIRPAPNPSLNLVGQCADANSAKTIAALIEQLPGQITDPQKLHLWELNGVGLQFLAVAMPPRVEGDRVVIQLDGAKLHPIVAARLLWSERREQRANAVRSASNMRMILQGALLYSNDHKGEYPDRLDQLAKYDIAGEVLTNPRGTGKAKPDYLYKKQPKGNSAPSDAVIVWENPDNLPPWPASINLGFGDGHVEAVERPDALKAIEAGQYPLPQPGAK